ncbi:hypothetical protein MRS44_015053 [Fusarium solani]|uniref:uncharacterized protein n=1 Tax=Fusarium solani TaxID=169388 RepID=UPI0032C3DB22|nr:hypothetical protein MRS44_015053 [Fusarium solani]
MASLPEFSRIVRFVPKSSPSRVLIGQPLQKALDVGVATRRGEPVLVDIFSGISILSPGKATGVIEIIDRILSPLAQEEVGTIRCIGLNYKQHAAEVQMDIPSTPTVFLKPATAIGDPWPAPTILPKLTQLDDCGDYESELAVIIGKTAKNVSEAEALDYILGYTAANDISSRTSQLNQSQWSFSKGFDGACPLGPVVVSTSVIPDISSLWLRGTKERQGSSRLWHQSTTLPAGTVIITGTPAGVGLGRTPKETLRHGDEFAVEILPHIGTLFNVFENEE